MEEAIDVEEEWDIRVSLFDGYKSESMEENLEYMFQNFGFFFPHSEFLTDAEGLMQYLGAKLSQGRIPLYCSGLNPSAKQFRSLKAVQRHMIDVRKCTMIFDDNEEEYEDFYDLDRLFRSKCGVDVEDQAGFELQVYNAETDRERILGNREFWYLYRQRHGTFSTGVVPFEQRSFPFVKESVPDEIARSQRKESARRSWNQLKTELRSNVNNNLPRNVPY